MSGSFVALRLLIPHRILEGTDKFMRHVKLNFSRDVDADALRKLIETAYIDMKRRVKVEASLTSR